MIDLIRSPRESARFGLRVARAQIDATDVDELISVLQREPIDVVILRLPKSAIDVLDPLRRHGFAAILADTLVRYEIDLRTWKATGDRKGVLLRAATLADEGLLESMTREIFAGYVSHYHANPLFPPDRILDGYAEWAATHVQTENKSVGAWIVERGGKIVGFSCYRIDAANALATGVLNGIMPNARGQGNYRGMLRAMLHHFSDLGLSRFSITTQAHNVAVQRTWTTEGLTLCDVSNTVHIDMRRSAASWSNIGSHPADSSR